jgi:hypothetical protein
MDKQLQPNNHKKHDSPLALSVSIEDEGIIRELLGRQLLRACHRLERIDLDRCGLDNTSLGVWNRPSRNESHHQSIKATVLCPSEFSLIPNVCT